MCANVLYLCLRLTFKGKEREAAKKEALDLSLKYEFVTPLTSMVVTNPQDKVTWVAHKPIEGEQTRVAYFPAGLVCFFLDNILLFNLINVSP